MWCIVFFLCVCVCVCATMLCIHFMTRHTVTPIHPQTSFLKGKSPENEVDPSLSYI